MASPKKKKKIAVDQYISCSPRSLQKNYELLDKEPQQLNHQPDLVKSPVQSKENGLQSQALPVVKSKPTPNRNKVMFCDVCKLHCNSMVTFHEHKSGRKHQIGLLNMKSSKSLKQTSELHGKEPQQLNHQSDLVKRPVQSEKNDQLQSPTAPVVTSKQIPDTKLKIFCEVCNLNCQNMANLREHVSGRKHRIRLLNMECEKLKENRNGIIITSPKARVPESYKVEIEFSPSKKAAKVVEFQIENCGNTEVNLCNYEIIDKNRSGHNYWYLKKFHWKKKPSEKSIQPGERLIVSLYCSGYEVGFYCTRVAFLFDKSRLAIIRDVEVQVITGLMKDLGPKTPYKHPPRVSVTQPAVNVEDGVPPKWDESGNKLEKIIKLEPYFIPPSVRSALNHGLEETKRKLNKDSFDIKMILGNSLSELNYQQRFSLLLHIEEYQMEVDIRRYDLANIMLDICRDDRKLLTLKVPGLAEKRPSILVGDHLFLRCLTNDGTPEKTEYKAYVHRIGQETVDVGVSPKLLNIWIKNMKFNCRFAFSRLPLQLEHRAVQLAEENSLYEFLFPDSSNVCKNSLIQPIDASMKFYNKLVENNEQQALAVRHIISGSSRPAPFLIFGPPGTGKTVTMVEAMKQVFFRCGPCSKILACASSNSAADLLVDRLLDNIPATSILRMNALSRDWLSVPEKIKKCCNHNSRGYYFPSKSEIMKLRVIVTTSVTAGRLVSANFPPGSFTHIFIDEAGQALEPEAIIPIAGIYESAVAQMDGGQIVLAGDPEQLGPVLRSPIAIQCGLAISLLERYMKTLDVYKRKEQTSAVSETYDCRLLVKLVRNYRSHPDILKVPNDMFYDGELEACADKLARESLCQWSELPTLGVPLIFHGVIGKDEREERSPSFFNTAEIEIIVSYVTKLLEIKQLKVQAKEIGIISPYHKQVQKIRKALKNNKDVTVGTVEEFQGQERKVIIISTVRSSTDFLHLDCKYKLGFLKNPKRFNVAVTRAKALLIVVGNPYILCHDLHWKELLQFCLDKGTYKGCEFKITSPENSDEELDHIIANFKKMSM